MRDTLQIGSTPNAEDCAQVGSENYTERSKKECRAYINQLIRVYGQPVGNSYLRVGSYPHDFGTYHEVEVVYHDTSEDEENYAFSLESGCDEWDSEARKELGLDIRASEPRELTLEEMHVSEDSLEELVLDSSVVPACCSEGCSVEPDGHCQHGFPSVLLKLGII